MASPSIPKASVQHWLKPDEVVRHIFPGYLDVCPSAFLDWMLRVLFLKHRVIVVTDRAVVVLSASRRSIRKPDGVVRRLPRNTIRAAALKHRWSRVKVGDEELWVNQGYYDDVRETGEVDDDREAWEPTPPEGRYHPFFASTVFLAIGLFTAVVGTADVFFAHNEEFRFVGATFAFAGILLLWTGSVVVSNRRAPYAGRKLATIACVAGVAVMSALAIRSLQYGTPTWPLWTIAALLLVVAAVQTPPDAGEPIPAEGDAGGTSRRSTVGRLTTVGITAGFLLSAFQFFYTSGYRPGQEGAALNLALALNDQGVRAPGDQFHVFGAKITVENKSSTRVQVLASQYVLRGVKVETTTEPDFADRVSEARVNDSRVRIGERTDRTYGDVLAVNSALPDGSYFEPQEKLSTDLSLIVPDAELRGVTLLHLNVELYVAKGSRVGQLGPPVSMVPKSAEFQDLTVDEVPMGRLSWVHRLAAGRHSIAVLRWRGMDPPETGDQPRLEVCVHRGHVTSNDGIENICSGTNTPYEVLRRFYGVVQTQTAYELPLLENPLSKPAPPG